MDITAITGAITAARHILDIGKNIEDQKIASAINSAVLEIQGKLLEAHQLIAEVQDENRNLKDEIRELKARQSLEANVSFDHGAYWYKNQDGKVTGPYCPSCWDLERKLVLPMVHDGSVDPMTLVCIHHKNPLYFDVPRRLALHLKG